MNQASEAAHRAVQLLALLLAVLTGSLPFLADGHRTPDPLAVTVKLAPGAPGSDFALAINLVEAIESPADLDGGSPDDDEAASVPPRLAFACAPSASTFRGAVAELRGNPFSRYQARAPPQV